MADRNAFPRQATALDLDYLRRPSRVIVATHYNGRDIEALPCLRQDSTPAEIACWIALGKLECEPADLAAIWEIERGDEFAHATCRNILDEILVVAYALTREEAEADLEDIDCRQNSVLTRRADEARRAA